MSGILKTPDTGRDGFLRVQFTARSLDVYSGVYLYLHKTRAEQETNRANVGAGRKPASITDSLIADVTEDNESYT